MLVPPEMIMKAGGWGQFVQSGALMVGPVLGAALMAAFELPAVILVDVIGAIIAVATVAAVRIPDPPKSHEKPHVWHELGEGWRASAGTTASCSRFAGPFLRRALSTCR